ncbi:hypothetical protein SATMO3_61450 [Sporomusa aerivorans]
MRSKHPDRTSEWSKQQQLLKNYHLKKLSTNNSDDTDKKQH